MTSTGAEQKLWRMLRSMETCGSHFRRQVPIGLYVVDFACLAAKLVIEVDGSQHGEPSNAASDAARTRWLAGEGYRVMRFWNNEITAEPQAVLEAIHAALYGSLDSNAHAFKHERRKRHPTLAQARRPSPSRGG